MFVQPRDYNTERWDGKRIGTSNCKKEFGIDEAAPIQLLTKYLEELVTKNVEIFTELPLDQQPQHDLLRGTFIDVDGSIATTRVKKPVAKKLPITARIHSSRELMDQFRLIKSTVEITLMQKSASIASRAIMEGIKATKPGFLEHQLHATIEYHSKMLGASGLAYVPVVAGGQNALILHYVTNNAVLKDGDLVLVDAGAEYGFYASDITRTWPVNGKFTTSQSAIYEIVLDCQKVLISNCIAGKTSLDSLQDYTFQYFKTRLSQLFKRNVLDTEMVDLYPHHVGHYIGLDVHDCPTISRSLKLHGGMCITIEPGLYIPNDAKYGEFAGIGVRIEDDVVVTDSEPLVLSAECVKEIEDIEALMK